MSFEYICSVWCLRAIISSWILSVMSLRTITSSARMCRACCRTPSRSIGWPKLIRTFLPHWNLDGRGLSYYFIRWDVIEWGNKMSYLYGYWFGRTRSMPTCQKGMTIGITLHSAMRRPTPHLKRINSFSMLTRPSGKTCTHWPSLSRCIQKSNPCW